VPWRLTVRAHHRVERVGFDDLHRLLDELERRGRELAASPGSRPVDVKVKRFDVAQQVYARLELRGPERWLPSVRAGVDVRGDGSSQAFRGGWRRRLLEPGAGEDGFAALRRALDDVLAAAGDPG
jgi:hypothetical protein